MNDFVNELARKDGRRKTQWEKNSITDIIASFKWEVLYFHHEMGPALKLTCCHCTKWRIIFCLPTEDKNICVINNHRYAFMRNEKWNLLISYHFLQTFQPSSFLGWPLLRQTNNWRIISQFSSKIGMNFVTVALRIMRYKKHPGTTLTKVLQEN